MEKNKDQVNTKNQDYLKVQQEYEMERAAILMKADEIRGETLNFNVDGQVELKNEIADLMLEQIDNPEEKYNLYYNVINRLLRKHLPKGDENKDARDLIYEEKNTYLTRGHRKNERGVRGADGRMGYVPDMADLVNIITEWITSRGTMFDLYLRLRELNESKGYKSDN